MTIPTRPGVTLNFVLLRPVGPPSASVVLFAGGAGRLGTSRDGRVKTGGNFLARTRQMFADRGFLTAVVDVPSDRRGREGLRGFRTGKAHRRDIEALIGYLRKAADAPVWLIGTSRGTISAATLGPALDPGRGDGVVLTASVTEKSRRSPTTALDAPLGDIAVPVLIVHHRRDGCHVSPYSGVSVLARELKRAAAVETRPFEGGDPPKSDPCKGRSAHGFLGIEKQVVDAIAAWIKRYAKR